MELIPELEYFRLTLTVTVALRVVGGDGKGNLESETLKYGDESHETRTPKYS
jgi:hypothetical protein